MLQFLEPQYLPDDIQQIFDRFRAKTTSGITTTSVASRWLGDYNLHVTLADYWEKARTAPKGGTVNIGAYGEQNAADVYRAAGFALTFRYMSAVAGGKADMRAVIDDWNQSLKPYDDQQLVQQMTQMTEEVIGCLSRREAAKRMATAGSLRPASAQAISSRPIPPSLDTYIQRQTNGRNGLGALTQYWIYGEPLGNWPQIIDLDSEISRLTALKGDHRQAPYRYKGYSFHPDYPIDGTGRLTNEAAQMLLEQVRDLTVTQQKVNVKDVVAQLNGFNQLLVGGVQQTDLLAADGRLTSTAMLLVEAAKAQSDYNNPLRDSSPILTGNSQAVTIAQAWSRAGVSAGKIEMVLDSLYAKQKNAPSPAAGGASTPSKLSAMTNAPATSYLPTPATSTPAISGNLTHTQQLLQDTEHLLAQPPFAALGLAGARLSDAPGRITIAGMELLDRLYDSPNQTSPLYQQLDQALNGRASTLATILSTMEITGQSTFPDRAAKGRILGNREAGERLRGAANYLGYAALYDLETGELTRDGQVLHTKLQVTFNHPQLQTPISEWQRLISGKHDPHAVYQLLNRLQLQIGAGAALANGGGAGSLSSASVSSGGSGVAPSYGSGGLPDPRQTIVPLRIQPDPLVVNLAANTDPAPAALDQKRSSR